MRGSVPLLVLLLVLGVLTGGCAAVPGSDARYGSEAADVREAVERGEGAQALAFHERRAAELERRDNRWEAARSYGAAAALAFRLGAYQRGLRAGLRARALLREVWATEETVWIQATVSSVLGNLHERVDDLEQARAQFTEGLAIAGRLTDVDLILFWSSHFTRGLAGVAFKAGDHELALGQAQEAVHLLRQHLARLPPDAPEAARGNARLNLAATLTLMGHAQRRLGSLREAEVAFAEAVAIARELGVREVEAGALTALGWAALDRGEPALALARFRQAHDFAARFGDVTLLMSIHSGTARSHAAEGRLGEALGAFERAVELVESVRGGLGEAGLRSGFVEEKQGIYHGAVRVAAALGKVDVAFGFGERARARAFLDLLGGQTMLSKGGTRNLIEEEGRIRARLGEAQALAEAAPGAAERAKARNALESAERDYRAFLDRVRRESLEQASLMTVEPATLAEVQRLLPLGTTLVEYLVTASETFAWVVASDHARLHRLELPRAELIRLVRELRSLLAEQAPLAEVAARAEALHERLVAPLRPDLAAERLLVVPHDVLHYLPFAALRSSAGRWLVDDYTLATLPSASVLRYLEGKGRAAADRVLVFGNPDVGAGLTLRWAEREARAIAETRPQATVLVRGEATEARAKALGGGAGILHFASHAELDERDPLASALLLAPGGGEDGRLEVREVLALELAAGLVVLSACETGLGKLSRGDELVGLQRAFLYAGTPAVVTTLWKVDDRASFELMREFYARLGSAGLAEALRAAQRAVMAEFPHPFAWAGFVFTGRP